MKSCAAIFIKNKLLLIVWLLLPAFYVLGCNRAEPERKKNREKIDYIKPIPGKNDSIPAKVAEKGESLISYADCYTCHKEDQRSVGPAFKDIAKRYPVNKVYIEMLAQKVIVGGSRSWGYAVMDPHPKLSLDDAKSMVTYILSLKK
ncbi:c-type cytochrome [Segetibacter koreensis]|uniref:c-type cytochrome n=1 Tax=Segetibacter koreensis TaxID=398037 RepID=UPI00036C143C|nr:c-type cytochrome [Segetibacter koreensis]